MMPSVMIQFSEFMTPTVILFVIIVMGYFLGKIRICSISFDISGVLIVAVLVGYLISTFYPTLQSADFENSMNLFSKLGTALFVASVGITAGISVAKGFGKNHIFFCLIGGLMVFIGFITMKIIQHADCSIDESVLKGIMCGAMTSTPGLSAVCEADDIISQNAVIGYSCTYLFGVIGVVMFVQLMMRNVELQKNGETATEKKIVTANTELLIPIAISVILGYIIGGIHLPYSNFSLGTSGGILCSAILVGFSLKKFLFKNQESIKDLSIYRNLGLVMFFVGSGIQAGVRLNYVFHIKWFLYGILLTVIPIAFGYAICRFIGKYSVEKGMCIISGGMTSTPAIGVLLKSATAQLDLSAYSFAYVGALLTMVVGIKII